MKKIGLIMIAVLAFNTAFGQNAIFYTIAFPNAAHHEAEISLKINSLTPGILQAHLSRSSPGRYATHEFGKNVYNIKAMDGQGKALTVKQVEGDVYDIKQPGGTVTISYTLFGNWTDGTYASIDPSHAHLNMPAVIMWVKGMDNRPIRVQFKGVDKYGWKIATQLKPEGNNIYYAPNLQYLMDSPTELSDWKESSWPVSNPDGKKQTINLVIHSNDSQQAIDNFAGMLKKMVQEEKAVFGEFPSYDYGSYTFLDDVYPTNSGDGMEHRNSTCIVQTTDKVEGNEQELLGTFAHEYFHSWNVKRIRPKSLEPFNFEHADMSSELWFAEGFTEYYGDMLLVRAGLMTTETYTETLGGMLTLVLNAPGASKYPATQMSRYAVFADAGVSIDPNNNNNIFTTYYYYGGVIALALDLRLRSDYQLTLDDYMRAVWLKLGKVMNPYTVADLQSVLAEVTKNPAFAASFFSKYIYGLDKEDYKGLLDKAGLILRKRQAGKAWIGSLNGLRYRGRAGQVSVAGNTGIPVTNNTAQGSPLYKAGIDAGDILLKADDKDLADVAALQQLLDGKRPGDQINITYKNRTGEHKTVVTLAESPYLEVVTYETAGKEPSKQQTDFRNNWLSSKVK